VEKQVVNDYKRGIPVDFVVQGTVSTKNLPGSREEVSDKVIVSSISLFAHFDISEDNSKESSITLPGCRTFESAACSASDNILERNVLSVSERTKLSSSRLTVSLITVASARIKSSSISLVKPHDFSCESVREKRVLVLLSYIKDALVGERDCFVAFEEATSEHTVCDRDCFRIKLAGEDYLVGIL